jgi:hypothetical protein
LISLCKFALTRKHTYVIVDSRASAYDGGNPDQLCYFINWKRYVSALYLISELRIMPADKRKLAVFVGVTDFVIFKSIPI